MKKVFSLILVMMLLVPAMALAEGDLTITSKNLLQLDGDYTSDVAYFFAKVENSGDAPIAVGYGKLVGFDDADEIIITEEYIDSLPSDIILQPGEYIYMSEYIWEDLLEESDVVDYKFSVGEANYPDTFVKVPCEATFEVTTESFEYSYIYITFTNPANYTIDDIFVTAALMDDAGNILFADGETVSNVALHAGSTITVRMDISSSLVDHYTANGLVPTTVDAMVFFEADEE